MNVLIWACGFRTMPRARDRERERERRKPYRRRQWRQLRPNEQAVLRGWSRRGDARPVWVDHRAVNAAGSRFRSEVVRNQPSRFHRVAAFCCAPLTVEKRHLAARKYLKAQRSRTGDKAICLRDPPTESPRRCLESDTMIALCSTIFCRILGPAFPGRHKSWLCKHVVQVRP